MGPKQCSHPRSGSSCLLFVLVVLAALASLFALKQVVFINSTVRSDVEFSPWETVPSPRPDETLQHWDYETYGTEILNAPFEFSACLLIKDDNRILPEWLAYHYSQLPLRRLILAVDPFNITSVEPIVAAYRQIGMNITVWRDADFFRATRRHKIAKANDSAKLKYDAYTWRQACLLTECLKELQRENRTWTILVDSDEFLVLNRYQSDEGVPYDCIKFTGKELDDCVHRFHSDMEAGLLPRSKIPPFVSPNSTAAHLIQQLAGTGSVVDKFPCIALPRITFGPQNSTDGELVIPAGFDVSHFRTLRDRIHQDWQNGNVGKCIMDASRYNRRPVFNPHKVSADQCNTGPHVRFYTALFRVHHYTGSLEEFTSRVGGDELHTEEEFHSRNKWKPAGTDASLRGWLADFVRQVGRDKAYELTEGLRAWAVDNDAKAQARYVAGIRHHIQQ